MTLPITTILAGVMGLLLLLLSARVIGARFASSGQEGSDEKAAEDTLTRRMRGQGNFIEYVPTVLILFALLELQNFNDLFLAVLAVLFAFARIIHGYAFAFTEHWRFGRFYGTLITFAVLGVLGGVAIIVGVLAVFA